MTKSNLGLHLTKAPSKSLLAALVILLAAGVVTFAQRIPTDARRWPATRGSMLAARSNACSVLLPDGRVLITGGVSDRVSLSSAEFFETDGSFSPAPSMVEARSDHACAVMPDGNVLVAGGRNGSGVTNATEIFDIGAGVWKAGPTMPWSRAGTSFAALKDGRFLLAGGEVAGVTSNDLVLFDPASLTFHAAQARLSSPRRDHAIAVLKDGRVLIGGGFDGEGFSDSIDLFDPATGIISSAGRLSVARSGLSATTLLDGRVVFIGGGDNKTEYGAVEVYEPKTGAIGLDSAVMAQPRRGHAALRVPNNNTVLLIGGKAVGQSIAENEAYVPWRHRFQASGTLEAGRTAATVLSLNKRGEALVAGGTGTALPMSTASVACVPTVQTDQADYAPGTTVTITGSCWQPGGTVQIALTEVPDNFNENPINLAPTVVTADGTFTNTTFAPDNLDVGVAFYLTATESMDGSGNPISPALTAQTSFTDANPASSGDGLMTVSPSNVTASSTGNTLTFTFQGASNNGHAFDVGSIVTVTIPGGWTAPQTANAANPGFVGNQVNLVGSSCNPGAPSVSGSVVTISQTCSGTDTFRFKYNASTAQASAGPATFTTATRNSASGSAVAISTQPTVNVTSAVGTITTVSSSSNPAIYGTAVTFTATVTRSTGSGTPTGSVQFQIDGSNFGSAVTLGAPATATSATATSSSIGTLPAGTHTVTAEYVPTPATNFGPSAGTLSGGQVVNQATVTPHITASNKVYDTTVAATILTRTLTGVIGSDDVTLTGGTATFADKNVGAAKTVTATGLSLTGTNAGNYALSSTLATTTADITGATVTPHVTASSKVYDTTTTATIATRALTGVLSTDVVTLTGGTATFGDKNVGTAKTVTATGLSLTGTNAGNYVLSSTSATTTADITTVTVTPQITANNKVYNATTAATIATRTLSGVLPGDAVSLTGGTAIFADKNVGTGKMVTATGLSLSGADAGNYSVTATATTTADITAAMLTVTAAGVNKVYEGNTNAAVTLSDNRIAGDVLTASYSSARFTDKNAGAGKTVNVSGISISGADAGNYTANTTASTTANITARALTVSASGINKVYDGTTTATVTLSDNRVPGDVFTASFTAATFATKAVGTGKAVSVTGISITGTDAANYTFNATASTTADITARTLTVTAIGVNRVYDGTTAATVTFSDTRVAGDSLAATGTATFADKNVGTVKPVSVVAISVSGTDAGNYTLGNTTASTTANITPRTLTVTAAGVNKLYDGNATATVTLSDDRVAGDVVTDTYATAIFTNKNAGTGKAVSVSGVSISGTDAGNYSLSGTTASTAANITARTLIVTATGLNRVYDGTSAATAALADDRLAGDVFTDSYTSAAFANKNVGTLKTVTVSGISISGADAGNYTFNTMASTTATITPRPLHVTAMGVNKVYDGTVSALVIFGDDRVSGDALTVSDSAMFADKNVGSGKPVAVSGIVISAGADAGNYTLANTTAYTTATISPRPLTVTATGVNKVYDGNTTATVTLTDDKVPGDDVTDAYSTAAFADKKVEPAKAVSVSGISISGTDAANYSLQNTTASTTADITKRPLTVNATGVNKVYDGTTAETVTISDNRVADDVFLDSYTNVTFADKNVGTGKAVSVIGILISGIDADNYSFNTTASTTANITPRLLHVTASGVDRVYDGTTAASVNFHDDRVATDYLTVSDSATFADKNVGTGKTVNVIGITVSGSDSSNYSLANTTTTTTASITARPLTVSATGQNKIYDRSTTATVTLSDNRIAGDVFTNSYATATFADKNVGTGKTVSVSGISISGTDAGNYTFNSTASTAADITQRSLTVTASAANKQYDGNTTATVTLADNRLAGDVFTDSYTSATFANKNVGTLKAVAVSGISISGADAGNYTFNTTATATADITQRPLTVSATGIDKVYDGTTIAVVTFGDNRLSGDVLNASDSASFSDKNVGANKPVSVIGISISGTDAGNYSLSNTTASTTASITARPLTVSAAGVNKAYDGTTTAQVTLSDNRVVNDVFTDNYTNATFADKNAGNGKPVSVSGISISGTDAGNYSFNTTASTTASITPRSLTVSATASIKGYDGNTTATVTLSDNRFAGDVFGVSYTGANFANKNVGTGKTVNVTGISISGLDAGNYTVNSTASTTANITPRSLTVTATGVNKLYDGTTAASATFSDNRVAGDALTVSGTATFADKNVGSGKIVTVTGIVISGADAGNYTLLNTTTGTTANITIAPTTTLLVSSLNPSTFPTAITFTATVTNTATNTSPVGTVTFKDGATTLGTMPLAPASGITAVASMLTSGAAASALSAGNHTITATFNGDTGNFSPSPCNLVQVVNNTPPTAVTITGPSSGYVAAAGTSVSFAGSFNDIPGDTHTAKWTFSYVDASSTVITLPEVTGSVAEAPGGGGTVTTNFSFASPGVYSVKLTVADFSGAAGTANTVGGLPAMIVIYDPSAGFVTGGGWINSNPGAYVPNPTLSGKASFGFVAKYQKGQSLPTGQTQFTFSVGNLDFHSTSYQWLVVSGPMAQYKGNGTINGSGNYGFMLTARDGSKAGTDGFRIKITDASGAVVYDNMLSADDSNTTANVQTLGSGSVQIHN